MKEAQDGSGTLATDGRNAAKDGSGEPAHTPRSLPRDASILWTPRLGPSRERIATPYDVAIAQPVLRKIHEHVDSAEGTEVGGLLAGRLCECPESGRRWVMVDAAFPAHEALSEDADIAQIEAALLPLLGKLDDGPQAVAGWYHSHTLLGVFLSERDARMHRTHFGEPWQGALVMAGDRDRPAGGLFQRTERGGLRRSIYVPFFEVLDEESILEDGVKRTCLDWLNYATEEEVVAEVAESAVVSRQDSKSGEVDKETAAPAEVTGATPTPPPEGRSRPPEPPTPGSRRVTTGGSDSQPEIPLVIPAGEDGWMDRTKRRYGDVLIRWVVLAALLGIAGWILFRGSDQPPPVRTSDPAATPGVTNPAVNPPASFQSAAVAFRISNGRYEERVLDFDLGRIDCATLATGYQATDEAFLALSEAYVAAKSDLRTVQLAEYSASGQEMDEIDQHFDASGCPRPE